MATEAEITEPVRSKSGKWEWWWEGTRKTGKGEEVPRGHSPAKAQRNSLTHTATLRAQAWEYGARSVAVGTRAVGSCCGILFWRRVAGRERTRRRSRGLGRERTNYKRRFSGEVRRALQVSFTELGKPACRRGESRRPELLSSHLEGCDCGDAVLFSRQGTQEGQVSGKDQELGIKGAGSLVNIK